jgi:carbon storage regulator CsrA
MLVLSRKSMERIQIGDNIAVTVLEIHGNKVRIGISAPREIRVLRSELQKVIPELPLITMDPAMPLLG